jgi:hypothetical protein
VELMDRLGCCLGEDFVLGHQSPVHVRQKETDWLGAGLLLRVGRDELMVVVVVRTSRVPGWSPGRHGVRPDCCGSARGGSPAPAQ